MAAFQAQELMFGLDVDRKDPDEPVILRFPGCDQSKLISCGRTQNKAKSVKEHALCLPCNGGPRGGLKIEGPGDLRILRNLKNALREALKQLAPVEQELKTAQAAEKAAKIAAKKAPAQKAARSPAKKAVKPPAKPR